MLGLSDFLTLQGQTTAMRVLKPWWDIFADYIIRVLLLISIVTGAVSLYTKDIVCIPAISCPPNANSSSRNVFSPKACQTYYNSNQYQKNVLGSDVTILTKFQDQIHFLYVNSECKRLKVNWFTMFFPFVLFYQAGACLVIHNVWLSFTASVTDQFSTLVQECYDDTERNHSKSEEEAMKVSNLQKDIEKFVSDPWNVVDLRKKVAELANDCSKVSDLQGRLAQFIRELNSNKRCCGLRLRYVYGMELFFQCVVLAVFFIFDLTWELNDGSCKCNIQEVIPGFVHDFFICSYSHSSFYRWSLVGFTACLILHSLVSVQRTVWFFKKGLSSVQMEDSVRIPPGDFAFLLNLMKTSNPLYLEPFVKVSLVSWTSGKVHCFNGEDLDD